MDDARWKLGTDGKFLVLGSATELPRIAAPGLGVLNVNYGEGGQASHVGKVAENVPSIPHTVPNAQSQGAATRPEIVCVKVAAHFSVG